MTCGEIVTVEKTDYLFRRFFYLHWVDDGDNGKRVSSAAFRLKTNKKPDPDCSLTLERIETASEAHSHGLDHMGLARFSASVPMGIDGHRVEHTPKCFLDEPERNEPGHCTLFGLTDKSCGAIAKTCSVAWKPKPPLPPIIPDVDD